MAPYVNECEIKASPATIWKACFATMKWENWDPDITHLENVTGELAAGTTFDFVMKEGPIKNIPVKLGEIKENELVKYGGSVLHGAMKFDSVIEIIPVDATKSRIKYMFEMHGILGSTIYFLNPKPVTEGVDNGLANMKKLSEEA